MSNEELYFDTLKRITKYRSVEWLKRHAGRAYGCDGNEAVEMSYENVIEEAKRAIKGKRRPGSVSKTVEREAAADLARDALGEIEG